MLLIKELNQRGFEVRDPYFLYSQLEFAFALLCPTNALLWQSLYLQNVLDTIHVPRA